MSEKTTIPPGIYFIGDPCYLFAKGWGRILDATSYFDKPLFEDNKCLVAFGTAYGDGVYKDQYGGPFCVDSGTIGATSIQYYEPEKVRMMSLNMLGDIVEFTQETECWKEGSVIHIGEIAIETDPEDDEEDE